MIPLLASWPGLVLQGLLLAVAVWALTRWIRSRRKSEPGPWVLMREAGAPSWSLIHRDQRKYPPLFFYLRADALAAQAALNARAGDLEAAQALRGILHPEEPSA